MSDEKQARREPNEYDYRCDSCSKRMIGIIRAGGREPRKVCVQCQEDYGLDQLGGKVSK